MFDLSGTWHLRWSSGGFSTNLEDRGTVTFEAVGGTGDFKMMASTVVPNLGTVTAKVFTDKRPPNPNTDPMPLTSVAILQMSPASGGNLPYICTWSGYERIDQRTTPTPLHSNVIEGVWTDFEMNSGRFHLKR